MNRLTEAKRTAVVAALVEGVSIRGTCRLTGVSKPTVLKLLADLGAVCADYQDRVLRNLTCQRIQADEIWSFCFAKAKNVTEETRAKHPDAGDAWTWTAIDADTKLCLSFMVGSRDLPSAKGRCPARC